MVGHGHNTQQFQNNYFIFHTGLTLFLQFAFIVRRPFISAGAKDILLVLDHNLVIHVLYAAWNLALHNLTRLVWGTCAYTGQHFEAFPVNPYDPFYSIFTTPSTTLCGRYGRVCKLRKSLQIDPLLVTAWLAVGLQYSRPLEAGNTCQQKPVYFNRSHSKWMSPTELVHYASVRSFS